jgi:O-acetyl-ADP-ribose deacetylase
VAPGAADPPSVGVTPGDAAPPVRPVDPRGPKDSRPRHSSSPRATTTTAAAARRSRYRAEEGRREARRGWLDPEPFTGSGNRMRARAWGAPSYAGGQISSEAVRIEASQGDITAQSVDAIVNAANSSLMGGGGVDGAIHRAGGPDILEECKRIREERFPSGLPTGMAVATTGGRLPARWVIHTVGPVYSRSEDRSGLLAECHVRSLRVAEEMGARSVAFPAISTGAYGYPLEEAAPVAVRAVRGAAANVDLVRFVLFDRNALDEFRAALES